MAKGSSDDGAGAVREQAGRGLVSCVVPAHNSAPTIGDAIASVQAQTYRPIELIVVDAGSTDGTRDIAADLAPEAQLLCLGDISPPAARNAGVGAARGEFVAFLDADDVWTEDKLAVQMEAFRTRPDLDMSVTMVQNVWSDELRREGEHYASLRRGQPMPGYATTTLVARRAAFERFGLLREDLWFTDSVDWFTRVREQGGVIDLIPQVLLYRRVRREGISRRNVTRSRTAFLDFLKETMDRRRDSAAEGAGEGT